MLTNFDLKYQFFDIQYPRKVSGNFLAHFPISVVGQKFSTNFTRVL